MRLLFAILFLVFGSTGAFAAAPVSGEGPSRTPDLEQTLAEKNPAERRKVLMGSLEYFDYYVERLTENMDHWLSQVPNRGAGIKVWVTDAAGGVGQPRIVVIVLGALPQASTAEQLCPGDVIRAVDGVRVDPLLVDEKKSSKDGINAIDQILSYLDRVTSYFRNGNGDQVMVVVERNGQLVELSPKVEAHQKFRTSVEARIAATREYLMMEVDGVERFRNVAQHGSDSEVVAAIHQMRRVTLRLEDVSRRTIPANFDIPPLCAKE